MPVYSNMLHTLYITARFQPLGMRQQAVQCGSGGLETVCRQVLCGHAQRVDALVSFGRFVP